MTHNACGYLAWQNAAGFGPSNVAHIQIFFPLSANFPGGWLGGEGFSKRPGWHVQESLECPGKMILVGVPAGEGNFAHGFVVLMQELPGFGNSNCVDILIEGNSDLPLECTLKARDAHPALPGCFFQGEVFH